MRKQRAKRVVAILLATAMMLQQSSLGTMASDESTTEMVTEAVTEAETTSETATEAVTETNETETSAPTVTEPETAVSDDKELETGADGDDAEAASSELESETEKVTEAATEQVTEKAPVKKSVKKSAKKKTSTINENTPVMITASAPQDITDFLTNVTFSGTTENGKWVVEEGTTYKASLEFAESGSGKQFDNAGIFTYQIPRDFPALRTSGPLTIVITDSDGVTQYYVDATYTIDENGLLTVSVDSNDPDYVKFTSSTNVSFSVNFDFSYTSKGEDKNVKFKEGVEKQITIKPSNGVTVNKSASFDETTGKVKYTVTVTSKGDNKNIAVKDSFAGDMLKLNHDVTVKDKDNQDVTLSGDVVYTPDNSGFEFKIQEMHDGDVYTVTYTADVDYSKVNGDLNWDEKTKNTLTAKPEDGNEGNGDAKIEHLSHTRIDKTSGTPGTPDKNGDVLVPWTITINGDQKEEIKDNMSVSDKIDTAGMEYDDEGLKVTVNGTSVTVPWSKLQKTTTGWTITDLKKLLEENNLVTDGNYKVKVEITYNTKVNVKGQIGEKEYTNTGTFDGTTDSGSAKVPGEGEYTLEKSVVDKTKPREKIGWQIKFHVKGTMEPCELVDTLPGYYNNSNSTQYYDSLDGELANQYGIHVDGLHEGEGFEVELDQENGKVKGFKLKFYYTTGEGKVYGLHAHGSETEHDIIIKYTTKTNQEWLENIVENYGYTHSNTVNFNGTEAKAEVTLPEESIEKTKGKGQNSKWISDTVEKDGIIYPLFYFCVAFSGVSDNKAIITDTFKPDELALYEECVPYVTCGGGWNYRDTNAKVEYKEEPAGTITFTITDLPSTYLDDAGVEQDVTGYVLQYCMIPKDKEALQKLVEKNKFNNAAAMGNNSSDVDVEWDYQPLDKSIVVYPENSHNGKRVSYKIEFNKNKLDLVKDSNDITITDIMKNLRLLPATLVVRMDGATLLNSQYEYNYSGESGLTITIPGGDEHYLEITYDADVIGKDGETITYSNEVTVEGYKHNGGGDKQVTLNTSGKGKGDLLAISLYKYQKGFMNVGLPGAEFELQVKQGGSFITLESSDGVPYKFTTGSSGSFTIKSEDLKPTNYSPGLFENEEYRLVETKAPEGYELDPTPIPFCFDTNGTYTGDNAVTANDTIYVSNEKENFHILKKDADDTSVLAGAVFTLYSDADLQNVKDTVTTDNEGIASFGNLDKGTYYLKETEAPEGYDLPDPNPVYTVIIGTDASVTGGNGIAFEKKNSTWEALITNTHTTETTSKSVEKVWVDGNDQDGLRPEAIDVQLKADGKAYGAPVKLNEDNNWSHTWNDLPIKEDGDTITYIVEEIGEITGYTTAYETNAASGKVTITNTHTTETTSKSVEKVWVDGNDQDGLRPESIEVQLNADGKAYGAPVELNAGNRWSHTWENLPAKAAGKDVAYTVEEIGEAAGYTATYATDASGKVTITNTHTTGTTSKSVEKVWVDGNDQDGLRPESIEVQLNADGEAYGAPVELNAGNGWSHTWENLPAKAAGKDVDYTVEEIGEITGYTTAYETNAASGKVTITNTHILKGSLSVTKTVSGNAGDKTKDFNFTVTLSDTTVNGTFGDMDFADGVATFTLKDGETKTAAQLPAGITYTVTEAEADADGYTTEASGDAGTVPVNGTAAAEFVNIKDEFGSLSVSKTVEGTAADAEKAFSFTVTLSDTEVNGTFDDMTFTNGVAAFTLKNGETKTATGLPVGVTYTVTEEDYTSAGYTTSSTGETGTLAAGEVARAAFVNTYKAEEGSIVLGATKVFDKELAGGEFTFLLVEVDESGAVLPGGVSMEATNAADGSITFGAVTYTEEGTHHYLISEVIPENDGTAVIYDTTAYTVTVTVEDVDGRLVATADVTPAQAVFTNKTIHFNVNKTEFGTGEEVEGAELEVLDKDGNVVASWTSKKGETHDFGDKLKAGESYTLREKVAPDGYGYVTDIEFTVEKDGTITAGMPKTTDEEGNETYLVEDKKIRLQVDKRATGTGEEVEGAELTLFDRDGSVVDSWTSKAGETHDFGGKLKAGETYTLRETVTPDGYLVTTDIEFTVNNDGTITTTAKTSTDAEGNTVYLVEDDLKPESHRGRIEVTKSLSLITGEAIQPQDATFYVALFADEARTQRVSEVKAIRFTKSSVSDVTFENLGAGTYYVAETDAEGNVLDLGYEGEVTFEPTFADGNSVTLESDTFAGQLHFENQFYDVPIGYTYEGELQITKKVLFGEDPYPTNETFYAGVFTDAAYTDLYALVPLVMDGSSETLAVLTKITLGEHPEDGVTYYVTETDENGVPLVNGTGLEYHVTVEGSEVYLSGNGPVGYVTITNTYPEEEESEVESEVETETETEKETEKPAPRTGDDTNYWMYLFLMTLALGAISIAVVQKRRERTDR